MVSAVSKVGNSILRTGRRVHSKGGGGVQRRRAGRRREEFILKVVRGQREHHSWEERRVHSKGVRVGQHHGPRRVHSKRGTEHHRAGRRVHFKMGGTESVSEPGGGEKSSF